jgi:large subunit ribosomal protein L30
MADKRVKITQTKGIVRSLANQKKTLVALGLKRINHTVEHNLTPQISGMIRVVSHMVKVEEI